MQPTRSQGSNLPRQLLCTQSFNRQPLYGSSHLSKHFRLGSLCCQSRTKEVPCYSIVVCRVSPCPPGQGCLPAAVANLKRERLHRQQACVVERNLRHHRLQESHEFAARRSKRSRIAPWFVEQSCAALLLWYGVRRSRQGRSLPSDSDNHRPHWVLAGES